MDKNAINWFEIPVTDYQRAKKFYEAVFDYQMPEMILEKDILGMLPYDQEANGVGGAIIKGDDYTPSDKGIRIYFPAIEDMQILLERVTSAGGKVLLNKTLISEGIGYYSKFMDTEGNLLSFHSEK